jgi:hypothetical protein
LGSEVPAPTVTAITGNIIAGNPLFTIDFSEPMKNTPTRTKTFKVKDKNGTTYTLNPAIWINNRKLIMDTVGFTAGQQPYQWSFTKSVTESEQVQSAGGTPLKTAAWAPITITG